MTKQGRDQIFPTTLPESGQHILAAFGQVPEQQGFLLSPLIWMKGDVDDFAAEGVATGMIDTGGQAARGGSELLNLLDAQVVLLEKEGDIDHVVERAAGMRADEVGHNSLLFPQAQALLTEISAGIVQTPEAPVCA